jgi:aspartyl-tRNA(Asn)/glutamyl-tRNA(Gln) amidotransferase subunit C
MKITDNDVAYVADLANLELTSQERQRMLKDLNSIVGYIDRLNELDTSNVPPMEQPSNKTGMDKFACAWRDDLPRPSIPHTEALKNAPETDSSFFKVPKVIEK